MITLETFPAICPGCQSDCEATLWGGMTRYLCDTCAAADKARRVAAERRERCTGALTECVPPAFLEKIDPERLNAGILPALEMDGKEGVGLIGKTGSGKTRVAHALLIKAAKAGLTPYSITAGRFRQAASDRHGKDGISLEILRACRFAQCLVLDDVGKGNCTDGADEALFDLLTERRDHRRVTIWTANGDGKWIAAKYGPDRGPAIAVRLANLAGCSGKGTGRIYTAV